MALTEREWHTSAPTARAGRLRRRLGLTAEEIRERVHELRVDGWSLPKIARMWGCHHTSLLPYLRQDEAVPAPKNGMPTRDELAAENRKLWDRLVVSEMEIGRLRGCLFRAADEAEADAQHPGLPVFWRDRWRDRALALVKACRSPFPGVDPDNEQEGGS